MEAAPQLTEKLLESTLRARLAASLRPELLATAEQTQQCYGTAVTVLAKAVDVRFGELPVGALNDEQWMVYRKSMLDAIEKT